jgi:hypothetical protein
VSLCSKHPVPVILCNYDGFYSDLMGFLKACDKNGTVGASELHNVIIAADNDEVTPEVQPRISYANLCTLSRLDNTSYNIQYMHQQYIRTVLTNFPF